MKRSLNYLFIVLFALLGLCGSNIQAQNLRPPAPKEIAITIDDLPLNGAYIDLGRLQSMTEKILTGVKQNDMPVVGFVNESLLYYPGETDARIAILKAWSDAGVELGNHTFSHLGFKDASLASYQDDFIRGDAVTSMIMKQRRQKIRFFRHPFLQMGPTAELEKAFEQFIADRGYRIAPVTMDSMDWMFLSAYAKALKNGDAILKARVSEAYLQYVKIKLGFCEQAANGVFGRPIKHILLLHANELNADNFAGLVKVFKDQGYRFITLEEALKDSIYEYPERYLPTSDWLALWAFNKNQKLVSPSPPDFIQKAFAEH